MSTEKKKVRKLIIKPKLKIIEGKKITNPPIEDDENTPVDIKKQQQLLLESEKKKSRRHYE